LNRSSHRLPLASLLLATFLVCGCDPTRDDGATPELPPVDPASIDDATFEAARNSAFQLDEARSLVGEARADIGDVRDALLAAHAMRPQAFGVNRRLGHLFTDLRMNVPAVEHFRMALDSHPDDNSVRQSLIAVLAMIEAEDEMLVELPLLRADPEHVGEALFLEARLLDKRGERENALTLLGEAEQHPAAEVYRALSLHGRYVFQSGDHASAQLLFSRAQKGRPDYKEAIKGLADCARRLGRPEEGDRWSSILSLLLALTDDEYGHKREDHRKQKLTELLELLPEYTNGYRLLADLHRRSGDVSAACAVIERFISLHGALLEAEDLTGLRERYCKQKGSGS
jgi:tetratricopeptide (TPR) repeat protein